MGAIFLNGVLYGGGGGSGEGQIIQVDSFPEAAAITLGKIYQYIGDTDENYTNGYFYKCIERNGAYLWERLDVQPPGTSVADYEDLENKPQINGTLLVGNRSLAALGITSAINDAVSAERSARQQIDKQLSAAISAVVSDVSDNTSAIGTINQQLSTIVSSISTETSAREAADTALRNAIAGIGTYQNTYENDAAAKAAYDSGAIPENAMVAIKDSSEESGYKLVTYVSSVAPVEKSYSFGPSGVHSIGTGSWSDLIGVAPGAIVFDHTNEELFGVQSEAKVYPFNIKFTFKGNNGSDYFGGTSIYMFSNPGAAASHFMSPACTVDIDWNQMNSYLNGYYGVSEFLKAGDTCTIYTEGTTPKGVYTRDGVDYDISLMLSMQGTNGMNLYGDTYIDYSNNLYYDNLVTLSNNSIITTPGVDVLESIELIYETNGKILKKIVDTSDISSIEASLATKANVKHTHTMSDITDLQDISAIIDDVNDNTNAISAINTQLSSLIDSVSTNTSAISTINTKLSGIAEGAQVNTIESISVNGTAVSPDANKNVALTVMTNAVNDLVNYYLKSETYTKTEVDTLIGAITSINIEVVPQLPTTDISTTTIYLVPSSDPGTENIKDEYICLDATTTPATWEKIGSTAIDVSGKANKVESATSGNLATLDNTGDLVDSGIASTDIITISPTVGLVKNDGTIDSDTFIKASGITGLIKNDGTIDSNDYATTSMVSEKVDKLGSATENNIPKFDSTGNLDDSGIAVADIITKSNTAGLVKNDGTIDTTSYISDISGKADKVSGATNGNFAGLDANGNLTDSGKKASDFYSSGNIFIGTKEAWAAEQHQENYLYVNLTNDSVAAEYKPVIPINPSTEPTNDGAIWITT